MDDNEQADDAGHGFREVQQDHPWKKFLAEMDRIVPWGDLCTLIAPVYPMADPYRREIDALQKAASGLLVPLPSTTSFRALIKHLSAHTNKGK